MQTRQETETLKDWPGPGHRCELVRFYREGEVKPHTIEVTHYDVTGAQVVTEAFPNKTRAGEFLTKLFGEWSKYGRDNRD